MKPLRCMTLAAGLAILLAACGGDGSQTAEDGDGGPTSIRVGETAGVPSLFLSYGIEQGFFEEEGLEVETSESAGGSTVIPALVSGDLDVAGSNVVSVMIAADQGLPITMIAAGTSTADTAEEDFSGIVVPEDSPIEAPEDLVGKEVAVNTLQNINDVVIGGILENSGLDPSGASFVELPFPDMLPALQRGDVDAALLIEPFLSEGLDAGMATVSRPYYELQPNLQIGSYVMPAEAVQEDPDLAERFQAAVQRTADAIAEDPEAFRSVLPELGEFDAETAERMKLPAWQGTSDRESLQLIADLMYDYGLVENEIDLDGLVHQ